MILQHDLQMVGVPHVFFMWRGVLKMGDPRVTMVVSTPNGLILDDLGYRHDLGNLHIINLMGL